MAVPVQCDPVAAASLLQDARIEELRAPVSHSELLPGLALASPRTLPNLREALTELCADSADLSLSPADTWVGADWAAHTFVLSRSQKIGCALTTTAIAISVIVGSDRAPAYHLRSTLPVAHTPIGQCGTPASWREELTVAGGRGPVRVVVAKDMVDGVMIASELIARRATEHGWEEQVLMSPAPPRLTHGGKGPAIAISDEEDNPRIVAYHNRTGSPPACEVIHGQTVWTWNDAETRWSPHQGRTALAMLAEQGHWRLAGDDAYFLIMALHVEDEYPEILAQTLKRCQKRSAEPLYLFPSSGFPLMNPGFWIIAPAPWPTLAEADDAKKRWRSLRRSYVRQGWEVADACASDG